MVVIENTGFGYIVVDGIRYEYDIIICNDKVMKRPKHLSKKYASHFNHTPLSPDEMVYLLNVCRNVEVVIIGKGQYGALPIMDKAINELKKRGLKYMVGETPKIIRFVNEYSQRKSGYLAILHVTC